MIFGSMSFYSAYATSIPAVQKFVYHMPVWNFGYGVLITLSTQLIGLSFACFTRRFLVWPASLIWPTSLPSVALLNSLHGVKSSEGMLSGISRSKYFWIVCGLVFVWQWFPEYIFTMLSADNWF